MSDLRKHMDCMPDGCLVGDGQCPVLGQVPWPGPNPKIDLRERCIEAAVAAVGKIDYADREIIGITIDAAMPLVVAEMWKTGTPEQVRWAIETDLRERIADRIASEFEDDPWIFNHITDGDGNRLAIYVKDMAIRVARGDTDE